MSSFMNIPGHPWHPKGSVQKGEGWLVLGLFSFLAIAGIVVYFLVR